MTIPMLAGNYSTALLALIQMAASVSFDRNRLDRAVVNVNLAMYQPRLTLDAETDAGA